MCKTKTSMAGRISAGRHAARHRADQLHTTIARMKNADAIRGVLLTPATAAPNGSEPVGSEEIGAKIIESILNSGSGPSVRAARIAVRPPRPADLVADFDHSQIAAPTFLSRSFEPFGSPRLQRRSENLAVEDPGCKQFVDFALAIELDHTIL